MGSVGQQLEIQSFFSAELPVRVGAVHAHAQNYRIPPRILGLITLKIVRLNRAAAGEVLGIEVKNHPLSAMVFQADLRTFL